MIRINGEVYDDPQVILGALMQTVQGIGRLFSRRDLTVKLEDVNKDCLNSALDCLNLLRADERGKYFLGVVRTDDVSFYGLGSLISGKVVLCEEQDEEHYCVKQPYCSEVIERTSKLGCKIFCTDMINVPKFLIWKLEQ